jgi:hypothetical protein
LSQDQFQLVYDGPDVRQGSMDVYDLAPALLSVGDLVRETNRFFNQDRSKVAVQVRSDFQRGSFEVALILDQGIVEQTKQVLFGGTVVDARGLVDLIFGHPESLIGGTTLTTGAVMGLIKVYKILKGARPAPASVKIEDNSTTLIQNINVEAKTAQLYMNDAIRSHVDRVVRPLAKVGIDFLEVRKEKQLIDRLEKADVPERVYESSPESGMSEVLFDSREALLNVIKVDFEKGKWRFSDGTAKFAAAINDSVFQAKLDNREIGFYKGDVLRVRLKTTQIVQAAGNLKTEYSIEEVLEHSPLPKQQSLLSEKPARRFRLKSDET